MIKVDVKLPLKYNSDDVKESIRSVIPVDAWEISDEIILKRTLRLSDAEKPCYSATVALSLPSEREKGVLKMRKKVKEYTPFSYTPPPFRAKFRPVVVGAGPAGLFAALTLAEAGARPILLERGLPVEERGAKVSLFNKLGIFDGECNVQFGEGGAGTYSDGKLKVGAMDEYKRSVLDTFIRCGGSEDIAFSSSAHLGTDKLSDIVKKIRLEIIARGGECIFSAKVVDVGIRDLSVKSVTYERGGQTVTLPTDAVIFACGHSARDTVSMLYEKGLRMSARGFGVGMRIEHPREYINELVYKDYVRDIEETASYHLVTHLPSGRSVYSFCMCPGGSVVAATGSRERIVTNGMSEFSRKAENSNAALLVSVTPDDFASDHPLAGFDFQDKIERRAYGLTSEYRAPCVRLCDLMTGDKPSVCDSVRPSYPRGVEAVDAKEYLPIEVVESLREGIRDFDDWMPGYLLNEAALTGPETRTTSPVRIHRDGSYMAEGVYGLFPAGEGAGYAGGIVSSAVDGMRAAEKLILTVGSSV